MSDLNQIVIQGHLTKSAELGHWTNGEAYCKFCIGNNETYKAQNGEYESIASFFDCVIKGNFAETMSKHLVKGRGVILTGRLKQQRWERDGNKYSRIVIKVEHMNLSPLNQNISAQTHSSQPNFTNYQSEAQNYENEYIPFEIGGTDGNTDMEMGNIPF